MSYNGGRSDSLLGSTNGGSDYSMSVSPYDSQPDTSTLLGKAKANRLYILYGIIGLLTVIIIALSAALHGAQSGSHTVPPPVTHSSSSSTGVPAPPPPVSPSSSSAGPVPPPINPLSSSSSLTPGGVPALRDLVTLDKLMHHARQLQRIADENYGNRYINMRGFNATVAYIESVLRANASTFAVNKQYFTRAGFQVAGSPDLTVSAAGDTFTYAYGSLYNVYIYSRSLLAINAPLVSVPNGGCTAADWANAVPSQTQGGVALVVRAGCSVTTRERLANGTGVIGVIEYNNDPSAGLLALEANPSTLGWLSMRYEEGKTIELIIQAAGSNPATPVTVSVNVSASYPNTVITNVCADTPTGSDTSVIVIGSHSDGVIAGSGMNDNGSGTCGNLVWATAVHELLTTRGAAAFPNKLRFCWWGAEEQGLLGSRYYVEQAKNATRVGWRLADHQMNLNYDMMASPNFLFGVLNGTSGYEYPNIPRAVVPGSAWLTTLFGSYYEGQGMPWDGKAFNGRSDYGPFLEAGLPAGGVSAFIDRLKTQEERDRYTRMLGAPLGGIAGIPIDPCYHLRCDNIANLHPFAFEHIGKATGAVLEQLARMQPDELKAQLFPQLRTGEDRPLVYTPVDMYAQDVEGMVWE